MRAATRWTLKKLSVGRFVVANERGGSKSWSWIRCCQPFREGKGFLCGGARGCKMRNLLGGTTRQVHLGCVVMKRTAYESHALCSERAFMNDVPGDLIMILSFQSNRPLHCVPRLGSRLSEIYPPDMHVRVASIRAMATDPNFNPHGIMIAQDKRGPRSLQTRYVGHSRGAVTSVRCFVE